MRNCPHCDKPAPSGSNGHRQRQCAHCKKWLLPVSQTQREKRRRLHATPPHCRELLSALKILERTACEPKFVALSERQQNVLKEFLREIIGYVRSRDRCGLSRPRAYRFDGGRVHLGYSMSGALQIYSSKTGDPLATSFPMKLW